MRPQQQNLLLGLDFGSDSVRSLLVDGNDGQELATAVAFYPRWKKGLFCEPRENRFRQHPLDYLESLEEVVRAVLAQVPGAAAQVRAIGLDTTGSTPALADEHGTPLALTPGFENDPDAMFILWKDHTALQDAQRINHLSHTWGGVDYTKYSGGTYSSEWFWAKALHVLSANQTVSDAARTIVEHCDWIPAELCGVTEGKNILRSRCAAGHKAMWHKAFGSYPDKDFLSRLHPRLQALALSLGRDTLCSDQAAGTLTPRWATRLGLPENVVVAIGAIDAHMGAVGAGIKEGTFLRIMGTSTCDIMIGPRPKEGKAEHLIDGICGQVDGSVIPGFIGYEAGQSAYGDIFAWFRDLVAWPLNALTNNKTITSQTAGDIEKQIIPLLDEAAKLIPPQNTNPLAIDWLNGRRTPDANQALKAAITGLSIGTNAPAIYRSLVEAVAYGSRAIVERFREQGVDVKRVVATGGVAKKSAFVMQTLCDVLNMPIEVAASEQTCALGACICAAVASGLYPDVLEAQKKLASPVLDHYVPDTKRSELYHELYKDYVRLGTFIESETNKKP